MGIVAKNISEVQLTKNEHTSIASVTTILILPLALCLLTSKLFKIAYTSSLMLSASPTSFNLISFSKWILDTYSWSQFLFPFVAGLLGWRFVTRYRILTGLAASSTVLLLEIIGLDGSNAKSITGLLRSIYYLIRSTSTEIQVAIACIWRETLSVATLSAIIFILLRFTPQSLRASIVKFVQFLVILTCLLLGVDLVYLLATGQQFSTSLIFFSTTNAGDLIPLVRAEVTPVRLFILFNFLLAVLFYWRKRQYFYFMENNTSNRYLYINIAVILITSVGLFTPVVHSNRAPYERFTDGTLYTFVRSLISDPTMAATQKVAEEFKRSGIPNWHSANLKLMPNKDYTRRNVVIIMLESFRADSTTMYNANLNTTPFLAKLSQKGALVDDMSVVIPRTV